MAEKQDTKDHGKETSSRDRSGRLAEASERARENTGEAMRSSGQTMQHGMHIAGEAVGKGFETAGEVTRRGMAVTGESARQISQASADRLGDLAEMFSESVKQSTEDFGTLLRLPGFGGGVEQMQQAVMGMVTRVVQANVKAAHEVMRAANPGIVLEMQQRFARHCLDGLIEGSAEVLRVSRHLAEDALQPIEERAYRRQHRQSQQGGSARREHETHKVAEVMSRDVEVARPDQSVQEIARKMAEMDAGALPVGEDDRLVGMVTDRDIAVRVAAEGKDPRQTQVRDIMSEGVRYCFEDEDVEDVAENMADQKVHRLPVMSRNKQLVGVISLGDIATTQPQQIPGAALRGISQGAGSRREPQRAFAGQRPRRRAQSDEE